MTRCDDPASHRPRGAVLLTGATGFLGAQVARRLLACTDYTVYALIRAEDAASASHRLSRAWWDWPELAGAIGNRVQVLAGDVTQPRLGLSEDGYAGLVAGLTHIVHTAADLRVNAPIAELRKTNLQGTEHVLELAQAAQADHGLARYAHVSTAYVAGGRSGPVPEDALTDAYGFSCAYEFSKYEGERLVQAARARPAHLRVSARHDRRRFRDRRDQDFQHVILSPAPLPGRAAAADAGQPHPAGQPGARGLRGRRHRAPDPGA